MDLLHAAGITRRPRHRHRLAAAVADAPPPRDAAGDPGRAHAVARRAPGLLPQLAGLPRARPGAVRAGWPSATATTRRSRCGTSPTSSAATTPAATATSARRRSATWLRRRYDDAWRAQRRLGHGVLVPALRRLRAGPAAARGADPRQPHPAAGLRALLLRRAARLLRRRARRAAPAHARACRSPPTSWSCGRHAPWTTCAGAASSTSSPTTTTSIGAERRRPPRAGLQRRPHPRHRPTGGRGC